MAHKYKLGEVVRLKPIMVEHLRLRSSLVEGFSGENVTIISGIGSSTKHYYTTLVHDQQEDEFEHNLTFKMISEEYIIGKVCQMCPHKALSEAMQKMRHYKTILKYESVIPTEVEKLCQRLFNA